MMVQRKVKIIVPLKNVRNFWIKVEIPVTVKLMLF